MIDLWEGKPVKDMPKEELIEALKKSCEAYVKLYDDLQKVLKETG